MNYKPFSIEQAKAGKPVITRDGRPARIVCFDRKQEAYPLFGFSGESEEYVYCWTLDGKYHGNGESPYDLFMAPEEKTVWVNLWRKDGRITTGEDTYKTKEAATDWILPPYPDHVGAFPITYQE